MNLLTFSLLCASGIYSVSAIADTCHVDSCSITDNCRCSSVNNPLSDASGPQLISLTFDESIVDVIYTDVWVPLLFNLVNPDGNPIGATFFVPHEYTDYSRVHDLYIQGFEIGTNSITKNSSAEYWSTASVEALTSEFDGQRSILSNFANIPKEDIIGVRTPQLQIQGDVSIQAYIASGIQYDSSMTSRSTQMMLPYTLDFLSTQECRTGTTCPTEAHPGFWVNPIIDLQGNGSTRSGVASPPILECNSLLACNIQGSAEEIAQWLEAQVERERSTNRAPMTLMIPSAWFRVTNNSLEGLTMFLDTVLGYGDVFLVSQKQVVEWMKNPVSVSQFQTDVPSRTADCNKINCPLPYGEETRYMESCVSCPAVYPWLGNPLGLVNPDTTTTQHTTPPTTTPPPSTTPPPTTPTTTPPPAF